MIELSRRIVLAGLASSVIAAPAVVRAASLMPISAAKLIPPPPIDLFLPRYVIDRFTRMPANICMTNETWAAVISGEHQRYRKAFVEAPPSPGFFEMMKSINGEYS
jgi:hypothetical protein